MEIGDRIKLLLKELNMTSNTLADKVGLSSGGISKVINNNSKPSAMIIGKIANELNTTTDYLILGQEIYKDTIEAELLGKFRELSYDNKITATKQITELWMEQNRPK